MSIDTEHHNLERSLDWKQGLAIAIGVPLLILPSIGYFSSWVWSFSIVVWALSVCQGFAQNLAYGELATTFPKASGLPGFAQNVFKGKNPNTHYDRGRLIGGFSAWSYWFAWNPVLAIFAILAGTYLQQLFPGLSEYLTEYQISLIAGIIIFSSLMVINYRGVTAGAATGVVLAWLSFIPLAVITLAPYATGEFDISRITTKWLPDDWVWNGANLLKLAGLFAMAQWSACAWETAAIYGPEYKNPGKDIPRALFVCGTICMLSYVVVQTTVIGTIGIDGIAKDPTDPMLPVARAALGEYGGMAAIVMLIAAMVLIIQTAYLGASRALHSMAMEGNLPPIFGYTNSHGTPIFAMVVIGLLNIALISMGTPTAILAASAIGYVCANGISLFAYVKARNDPDLAALDRPFEAPKGWKYVALTFGLFNLPILLIGVVYLNSLEVGWRSTWLGFAVLSIYVPLWFWARWTEQRAARQAGRTTF